MKKTTRYAVIFTVLGIGILIIGYSLFAHRTPEEHAAAYDIEKLKDHIAEIASRRDAAPAKLIQIDSLETYEKVSRYGKPANCLRGTEIDGGLKVDDNGKLVIDKGIVRLFEYFMSARSEESFETCIARIEEYIELTLPHDARIQALSLLYDYLNYKNHLGKSMAGKPSLSPGDYTDNIETARDIMQQRNTIRRQYLKPEVANAFFSDEEAYDNYVLDRVSLEKNNPSLSEDEKLKMIENIANNSNLPEAYKQKVIFQEKQRVVETKIAELRKQEGNEDTIYNLRKDLYGKEVADGLMANDKTRQDWEDRFNAYYSTKKAILNSQNLSENEKQQRITQLQRNSFSEKESALLTLYESAEEEKTARNP